MIGVPFAHIDDHDLILISASNWLSGMMPV
jgi:hypothetical protein